MAPISHLRRQDHFADKGYRLNRKTKHNSGLPAQKTIFGWLLKWLVIFLLLSLGIAGICTLL